MGKTIRLRIFNSRHVVSEITLQSAPFGFLEVTIACPHPEACSSPAAIHVGNDDTIKPANVTLHIKPTVSSVVALFIVLSCNISKR